MKRKFLKQLLVYSVCACMTFLAIPVLADSTTPTTISNEAIKTILADEVVPTSWDIVTESYILNSNDKTLDISSLPESAAVNPTIEIPSGVTSIAVKGNSTKTYNLSIIVSSRSTPLNLIIKDLKIQGTRTGMDITGNTDVTNLILTGENSIVSTTSNGIAVYTGNSLVIDADTNASQLTIQAGSDAAGIGGRLYTGASEVKKGNGKITIKGGTIQVVGGNNAAAIGSAKGEETQLQDITIEGGKITATGGTGGAGIGSGKEQNKDAGKIIIKGGEIVATGGTGGAGIGSGADLNNGKPFDIEITGGKITALGQSGGAGIGGGNKSHVNNIIITGGIIERAEGSGNSAGIGGGGERGFKLLKIGENNVKGDTPVIKNVKGGLNGGCAIGTGANGNSTGEETILLYSGIIDDLKAFGGAAAIGGGDARGVKEIQVGCTRIGKVYSEGGGTAIGGGRIGQNGAGTVTILPGAVVYADTDGESIIGGGKDRSLPVIIKGDVFSGKNNIDYIELQDASIKGYVFECYRMTKDGDGNNIRTIMTSGDFSVKNNNDTTIDLRPTTDGSGRIYAWLHDLGAGKLGGSGYYFKINEGGKVFHAVEFHRESQSFVQKMKKADGSIGDATIQLTVIQMEFVEAQFSQPRLSVNSLEGSKIVPYAVSNIDFISEISPDMTVTREGDDTFEWVKAEIDLKKLSTDITPFDLSDSSRIKLIVNKRDGFEGDGIKPKYSYHANLTADMNVPGVISCDNINKKITINYPNSMKHYGEYKISILVPNTLTKNIDKYLSENVTIPTGSARNKSLEAKIEFRIITHIKVEGLVLGEPREKSGTSGIEAKYWYLTKIN